MCADPVALHGTGRDGGTDASFATTIRLFLGCPAIHAGQEFFAPAP
jgi:hypothetical protein